MNTKNKIIKIALKKFCLSGYKEVSLTDIAKEVGITKPSLYHHFASKEVLFGDVLDYFFGLWGQWTMAIFQPDIDLKTALKRMLTSFDDIDRELSALLGTTTEDVRFGAYYLIFDTIRIFPEYEKVFQKNNHFIAEIFKTKTLDAIERGEIKKDIKFETVYHITGALLEGIHILKVLNQSIKSDDIGNQCFELIWNSIKA